MEISTKSINQSLNLYSIFGYLLPGFFLVTLLIIDYDFSKVMREYSSRKHITLEIIQSIDLKINYILSYFSKGTMQDFKIIPFIIFIFFCYLLGHIISAISSLLLERLIVKKILGYPSQNLISFKDKIKYPLFFGSFRRSFKSQFIGHLKQMINDNFGYTANKEDYYWLCYSEIITKRPYLTARIHHFVNLYGFSRNITAALIIYLFIRFFILNLLLGSTMDFFSWITWTSLFICAFFMFWNYLKLFKRQAVDIYFLFLSTINTENKTISKIEENEL